MAKNVIIPQKVTGDVRTAAEDNQVTDFLVAPSQDLSTFDGLTLAIDGTGSYTNFTMSAHLSITFAESAHEKGNIHIVKITTDGSYNLTFVKPAGIVLTNFTGLTNGATLASGIYLFGFHFDGTDINIYKLSGANITNAGPTLDSIAVNSDNTGVVLTFSVGSYANNDGTGDLQVADFTAQLASGTATNPVLSVPTHSAGDSTAGFTLSYTGTANGAEVLTITPADGASVYEVGGTAMDSGETANDNLEDQTAPSFSSAEVGAIDDTTIRITMDEACDPASTPANSAFTPAGIASTPTVTNVNITGVFIDLTLSAAVVDSDTPTIAYTKPGSNMLKDTPAGNETASWTAEVVTNNVAASFTNTKSIDFNGTTQHLIRNQKQSQLEPIGGSASMSWSFWVKPTTQNSHRTPIAVSESVGVNGRRIVTSIIDSSHGSAPNYLDFILYGSTSGKFLTIRSSSGMTMDVWTHVVLTFDAATETLEMYFDAVDDSPATTNTAFDAYTDNAGSRVTLGVYYGNINLTDWMDGLLDEVAVYDKVLSQAEITAIFNVDDPNDLSLLSSYSNNVSWWRMEDDLTDENSGYTLTNINSAPFNADVP